MMPPGDDPSELVVKGRADGRLVVFAGAGVSVPSPASLPLIDELCGILGRDAPFEREPDESYDVYLGRLEESGVAVRARVQAIIGRPDSQPNALHKAIAELFPSRDAVRIVTTNFDRHLSAAVASTHGEVEEYYAPALHRGSAFRGLVYLHGAIDRDPADLVLTASDFARAYLHERWATHFTISLFESDRVVLFVGFSHRDTLLSYIAQGLRTQGADRLALTTAEQAEHFERLGIRPIVYDVGTEDDPHADTLRLLRSWAEVTSQDLTALELRLRAMAHEAPAGDLELSAVAAKSLAHPETAVIFARYAETIEWLQWAEQQSEFRRVFSRTEQSEVSRTLAVWFADRFATSQPRQALATLARMGGVLSDDAWLAIAWKLWRDRPSAAELGLWLTLLLPSAPKNTGDYLDYLLKDSTGPGDHDVALMLFEHLTTPVAELSLIPGVLADDGLDVPRVEPRCRADEYWLGEAWRTVFQPSLDRYARDLVRIVTKQLASLFAIHRDSQQATDAWDPSSLWRTAVESEEGDLGRFSTWMDTLIDIARDTVVWLLSVDRPLADQTIAAWVESEVPLLQRLAAHAVRIDPGMSGDAKIEWVVANGLELRRGRSHEVGLLLVDAYEGAGDQTRETLLDAIDAAMGVSDDVESSARQAHRLLTRLANSTSEPSLASSRLDALGERFPSMFGASEGIGAVGPGRSAARSPMPTEELLSRSPNNLEFVQWLLAFEDDLPAGETREKLLEAVSEGCHSDITWSLLLAESMAGLAAWDSDLWSVLLDAWHQGDLGDDGWERLLAILASHGRKATLVDEIASLLDDGARSSVVSPIPLSLIANAEAVAFDLWAHLGSAGGTSVQTESDDWLTQAINSGVGKLTLFLLRSLTRHETRDGDLPGEHREVFEEMIRSDVPASVYARVVLASQTHYLFSRDRDWTIANITPMLDGQNPVHALQAWDGFLSWGRLYPELANNLLPLYRTMFGLASRLGRVREQFAAHLAWIALMPGHSPWVEGWLPEFVTVAPDEDVVDWAGRVGRDLDTLPPDARAERWSGWMRTYLVDRQGAASSGEAGEWLEWTLNLPEEFFEESVDLVTAGPTPQAPRDTYWRLRDSGRAGTHPKATARLLSHAIGGQGSPFYSCSEVAQVFRELAVAVDTEAELRKVVEGLLRLQCPEAPALLDLLQRDS